MDERDMVEQMRVRGVRVRVRERKINATRFETVPRPHYVAMQQHELPC